jgi:hypothetical protein
LHTAALAAVTDVPLASGAVNTVLSSAGAAGTVADVNISFAVPNTAGVLQVNVLGGAFTAFINFVPSSTAAGGDGADVVGDGGGGTFTVSVGAGPGGVPPAPAPPQTANVSRWMPGFDLSGGDYSVVQKPSGFTPAMCQAECDKAQECVGWVLADDDTGTASAAAVKCCLKRTLSCPHAAPPDKHITSGAKVAGVHPCGPPAGSGAHTTDTLQLLNTDKELTLRVFVDQTIIEVWCSLFPTEFCIRGVLLGFTMLLGLKPGRTCDSIACLSFAHFPLTSVTINFVATLKVYFMDGRVAMTLAAPPASTGSVSLVANGTSTTASASVWSMGGIWITPEAVLATPRVMRP